MKKTFSILILMLFSIFLVFGVLYYDSHILSKLDIKVSYIFQNDNSIPAEFKDMNIVFISDIEYGEYFHKEQLDNFIEKLNSLDIDVLLFGGDLFDKSYVPVSSDVTSITQALSSINAKRGKFYILGDYDLISDTRELLVNKILTDSNFESLKQNKKLYSENGSYINLIGFNFGQLYNDELENISEYQLVLTHSTAIVKYLPDNIGLILSGHSHERQLNIPFKKYSFSFGKTKNIYITRGIGMSQYDYRLFNKPEIVVLNY